MLNRDLKLKLLHLNPELSLDLLNALDRWNKLGRKQLPWPESELRYNRMLSNSKSSWCKSSSKKVLNWFLTRWARWSRGLTRKTTALQLLTRMTKTGRCSVSSRKLFSTNRRSWWNSLASRVKKYLQSAQSKRNQFILRSLAPQCLSQHKWFLTWSPRESHVKSLGLPKYGLRQPSSLSSETLSQLIDSF